jgi:hypothetical protein
MRIKNRKQFAHRIDLWDDDGANLVDHLAGVEDLDVAAATYRFSTRNSVLSPQASASSARYPEIERAKTL